MPANRGRGPLLQGVSCVGADLIREHQCAAGFAPASRLQSFSVAASIA